MRSFEYQMMRVAASIHFAMTRTKLLELARRLPEDASSVVHTFPDNWSIRRFEQMGDQHREGRLMSHCLAFDIDDPESPEERERVYEQEGLRGSYPYNVRYSLRDPDNLPHVTFDHYRPGDGVCDILDYGDLAKVQPNGHGVITAAYGAHNAEPKPQYMGYIKSWLEQQPYNTHQAEYDENAEHIVGYSPFTQGSQQISMVPRT